jgi:hypothetical protein
LATCFDPVRSSSGLHYGQIGIPNNVSKDKMKGLCPMTYNMLKTRTALKNSLIGSTQGIFLKIHIAPDYM